MIQEIRGSMATSHGALRWGSVATSLRVRPFQGGVATSLVVAWQLASG